MEYQIFISYASPDTDLIENFKDYLEEYGVKAWVYSLDKTIAEDTWDEIKDKINQCRVLLFTVSKNTEKAEGQLKELEFALNKINESDISGKIFPIALDNTDFNCFPEELKNINGEILHSGNLKTTSKKIIKTLFPEILRDYKSKEWHYPRPGQWLEISGLDSQIEEHFDEGDKLYFRRISPMGLFECYSPKIEGLFWILPDHVTPAVNDNEEIKVPWEYSTSGMINIEGMGYRLYHEKNGT